MKSIPNPYPSPAPNPDQTQDWLDEMEDSGTFSLSEYGPIVAAIEDGNFYIAIDSWGYDSTAEPPSHPNLDSYVLERIDPLKPKSWKWLNGEDQDPEPPERCELIVSEWEVGPI